MYFRVDQTTSSCVSWWLVGLRRTAHGPRPRRRLVFRSNPPAIQPANPLPGCFALGFSLPPFDGAFSCQFHALMTGEIALGDPLAFLCTLPCFSCAIRPSHVYEYLLVLTTTIAALSRVLPSSVSTPAFLASCHRAHFRMDMDMDMDTWCGCGRRTSRAPIIAIFPCSSLACIASFVEKGAVEFLAYYLQKVILYFS